MPRKPRPKKEFYPEIEEETQLSDAGKKLIDLAQEFGEDLAEEVDKDVLLRLIDEMRRRDIPIVNKALRGLGFDISPIVYGALQKKAKGGVPKHIYSPLKKLVEEGKPFSEAKEQISGEFKGFKLQQEDYDEMKQKAAASYIVEELNKIAKELEEM